MSKEKERLEHLFEMCCVNVFPRSAILLTCEAVRYAQERTSPPFILGKPITEVEHLFICLAGVVCLSFFSYQRSRHLQYITVNQ